MKKQKHHWLKAAILLGCGLAIMLFWGALTSFMDLQPTNKTPAYLVLGAVGKFLFFPLVIGAFSYIFWAALLHSLNAPYLPKKTRRNLAIAGLIIPIAYLMLLPGFFVVSPLDKFCAMVFPFLDRYLYTPAAIIVIAAAMLPLALAFELNK